MMTEKPWLKFYDPCVPHTLDFPNKPVFYFLEEAALKYPQQACTIFQDKTVTYEQMNILSDRLAAALLEMGLQKGDRVAVFMPNTPQFVLAFFAILKAGGVVVAVNPTYKHQELSFQLNDSGAIILIGLSDAKSLLETVQLETNVRQLIFTETADAFQLPNYAKLKIPSSKDRTVDCHSGQCNLMDLLSAYAGMTLPDTGITGDDAAIFQYSGGTTGIPKAAIGLHRNLVANIHQFRNWLCLLEEGKQTLVDFIPLFHVYGMVIGMGVGIFLGARLVLIPNPRDFPEILRSIQNYKATFVPGVPTIYHAIGHHPDVISKKFDLMSIEACISGSAPLMRETKEQFEKVSGSKLVEGFGLSEAPTATHCNPISGENRTGSIGIPLPGVNARIVSLADEITTLPPGEPGELVVQGPQVMQGYHNMPEETAIALRDGWLYTGDIATMDEDGYFYIVDRKKDVIKPGGLQVWPREVEEAIATHPAVHEVGVAGVMHPQYGDTVKAWVVLKEGQSATAKEIIAHCKTLIADYKAPRQVAFIQQLPRTIVGKVLRRELVRLHNEQKG